MASPQELHRNIHFYIFDPSICLSQLDFFPFSWFKGLTACEKSSRLLQKVHLKFTMYKAELTIFPVPPHQKSVPPLVFKILDQGGSKLQPVV